MTYFATLRYVIVLLFLATTASPLNAAIILNCKTEKRIDIGGCGYGSLCKGSDGQSVTDPFFLEEDVSGWSYKLYADKTKLMFIREDGLESEWLNVPNKWDAEGRQFTLGGKTSSSVSASKATGMGTSKSLAVFDGKEFYFIVKDWHSFIEVGRCY